MAMEAQTPPKSLEPVKKEPQSPKTNENGENNNFRGGRGGRGSFRGNRGGMGGRGANMNANHQGGSPGGMGNMMGGVGNDGGGGGRGGYMGGRGGPHQDRGERGGYMGRGRGGGRGRGDRGGYMGGHGGYDRDMNNKGLPQDRIQERLKQLAGPLLDLPPREDSTRKFSNHCRLWIGNLPLDIGEDDVKELFKPYGEFDEVYFDKNKGFAFIRLDFKSNAEKARQELHMKEYKGRQLKIRFSSPGTALKIRNLSTWVTNELLEKAFGVFGELEKAIVLTDERGRATGEGIVEFVKKPAANLALKKCMEGCFFMVSSPRPVIVEQMALVDDNEGMSEININKRNPEYVKERQQGPRFAQIGSFEYEYGLKWKHLYELFDKKRETLDRELQQEKRKLEEQIEYAKYEHETEMLRDQLRQREEMNQRTKSDYENRQREWEDQRRAEEERQRRQEEELTHKFRQQEEELRRRQEENRQFMQERGEMIKNEGGSQDGFGNGGYQGGQDGSNWRRTSDGYGSQGGSSWRGGGGGGESWGRGGGRGGGGGGQSWGDNSWDNRPDPWQNEGRGGYQRGNSDSDLQPPPHPAKAGSAPREPSRGEEKDKTEDNAKHSAKAGSAPTEPSRGEAKDKTEDNAKVVYYRGRGYGGYRRGTRMGIVT